MGGMKDLSQNAGLDAAIAVNYSKPSILVIVIVVIVITAIKIVIVTIVIVTAIVIP